MKERKNNVRKGLQELPLICQRKFLSNMQRFEFFVELERHINCERSKGFFDSKKYGNNSTGKILHMGEIIGI